MRDRQPARRAAAGDSTKERAGLAVGAVLALTAVVFFQRTFTGTVADPDTLYHLGHAAAYLEGSPLDTSLPWARYSVIGAWGGDLWWGFHLLLLPFAAVWGLPGGIFPAGVAFTGALTLGVLWLAWRHRWPLPWMWPAFFLMAVPNVMYRHLMVRPHVLSLLAVLLLVSALSRRRAVPAAVAAGILTWIHAGIFWLPLAAVGVSTGLWVAERRLASPPSLPKLKDALAPAGAALAGMALGLLLRPRPLATLRLVDVQIFELLREQSGDVPLSFGGELIPLPAEALGPSSWVLLVPWAAATVVALFAFRPGGRLRELDPAERHLLVVSGLLSWGFLFLALAVAGRALVEWAAFGTIFVATVWGRLLPSPGWSARAAGFTGLVALLALPWVHSWHRLNVRLNALPVDHLRQAATWLANESDPGDVVYHAHWDNFAGLFGWNRVNHYLGGMDPIFQYAFDQRRYWEHATLAGRERAATTCLDRACTEAADTHAALVRDFEARWILVEPRRNPELFQYLMRDPRYDLGLRTSTEAVFEILR